MSPPTIMNAALVLAMQASQAVFNERLKRTAWNSSLTVTTEGKTPFVTVVLCGLTTLHPEASVTASIKILDLESRTCEVIIYTSNDILVAACTRIFSGQITVD